MLRSISTGFSKISTFKNLFFILALIILCLLSFGKAINSYFWKDDWALLWSANYNPQDFFYTTVGSNWLVRTGLFMYPYVLILHKYIHDSFVWQFIGLGLKVINSILFYFLILVITRKKHIATAGSLLYASYSGGIETYTWHRLNALATSFVLLGFVFYKKYLDSFKTRHFLASFLSFIFSVFSYVGRATGFVMVLILWNILIFLKRDIDFKKRKKILISSLYFLLPYILFSKLALSVEPRTTDFFY